MRIERVDLHHIELPMARPYVTVFEHTVVRPKLLVAVHTEGLTGWGECVASNWPGFSYETIETAWHVLRDFLASEGRGGGDAALPAGGPRPVG